MKRTKVLIQYKLFDRAIKIHLYNLMYTLSKRSLSKKKLEKLDTIISRTEWDLYDMWQMGYRRGVNL